MDINRKIALDILIEYDRQNTYPNLALKKYLRGIDDQRDKSFITALVYGVIEKRLLLDYYISRTSSVKLKKINIVVINILRLGLYQLIFMSTPQSAACNTSVELAKKNGQYKSAGFVNAILRKLASSYDSIELPQETIKRLSVEYSMNIEIVSKLIDYFGVEGFKDYMISGEKLANDIYACVNTIRTTDNELISKLKDDGIEAAKTNYTGIIKISSHIDVENSVCFKRGLFHIIGLPSYLCAKSVAPQSADTVLDMCAAPGGKSFAMAYASLDKANITSFDIHDHKLQNMLVECKRLSLNNVHPVVFDSSVENKEYIECADRILCDVPCSGLGILFKKPDIKYNSVSFDELVKLQSSILDNAALYLKHGGRLVYSTCTVNPDENERQVDAFIKRHSEFVIDDTVEIVNGTFGSKLFTPQYDNCDGFYIAVLKKI